MDIKYINLLWIKQRVPKPLRAEHVVYEAWFLSTPILIMFYHTCDTISCTNTKVFYPGARSLAILTVVKVYHTPAGHVPPTTSKVILAYHAFDTVLINPYSDKELSYTITIVMMVYHTWNPLGIDCFKG